MINFMIYQIYKKSISLNIQIHTCTFPHNVL